MRSLLKWILLLVAVAIAGPAVLKNVDLDDLLGTGVVRQSEPEPAERPPARARPPTSAVRSAMPPCTNGRHAPPGGSCVIDGDSGWLEGRQWRMQGIDAPEIGKPECAAEKQTGERAKRRLLALLAGGFSTARGADD